ncbi:DUF3820 family protein [Aliikangiella sp. IMCC44653]
MFEKHHLVKIANTAMPFGKYQGRMLIDLPETYLVWFGQQGFPKGAIGDLMQLTLEIKVNGLESLIIPLKQNRT